MLKYKKRLFGGFFFIVFSNLAGIVSPLIVKETIDYIQNDVNFYKLLEYAGLIIGFTLISGFFRFLMRRTVIVVSRLIENDLRNDLFRKLQILSPAYFQRNNTGDIMSRLTNDLNAIRSVLGPGVMYTINLATTFIFVIIMMVNISPTMTVVALVPVPVMAVVVNRLGAVINRRYLAVQEQLAAISTKAQENLAGIRVVKSYVLEDSELKDFNSLNKEYIKRNMSFAKAQSAFQPSMMLIVGIGSALVLLFGGKLIINNVISLGDFVAFVLYLGMLVFPSIAIGWVLGIFLQGAAANKRLDRVLSEHPEIYDHSDSVNLPDIKGNIEFRNVTFSYNKNDAPVLRNINLSIPSGNIVAVVGKTGSGKSTLMHLLTRSFDAPRGSIFVDNYNLSDIKLENLRSYIGYIPQDTFLFSDTIANNIAFGAPNVSREQIEKAAQIAQIHDSIIDLPKGYDTILGERGINISGGQKQRLSIARAILKEPRILLLDDALSAVDTITEEKILNNLKDVMLDKTCLWVSHRISAIKNADFIIVLEDGEIIEQGTHDELLQINGLYADLYEKQQLEDVIEHLE